jgi:hypothetical protein
MLVSGEAIMCVISETYRRCKIVVIKNPNGLFQGHTSDPSGNSLGSTMECQISGDAYALVKAIVDARGGRR